MSSSDEGEVISEEEKEEEEEQGHEEKDLEEGELITTKIRSKKSVDEEEELEEGEVEDELAASSKVAVCRFFGKGLCTWGASCRFLHPGVTDKGLYTMFDPVPRPPPTTPTAAAAPVKTGLLGHAPPNFQPIIHPLEVAPESAWERGCRHAKEIIKQSAKRKESDVDFEEKKMNLSLAQDEIDKENDYYVVRKPLGEEKSKKKNVSEEDEEEQEENLLLLKQRAVAKSNKSKIDVDFVRERVHRIHGNGGKKFSRQVEARSNNEKWQNKTSSKKMSDSSSNNSSDSNDSSSRKRIASRKRSRSSSSDSDYSNSDEIDEFGRNRSNRVGGGARKIIRKAPPRDDEGAPGAFPPVRIAPPLPSLPPPAPDYNNGPRGYHAHSGHSNHHGNQPYQRMNNPQRGGNYRYAPNNQINRRQNYSPVKSHPRQQQQQQQQRRGASPNNQRRYYRSKFSRERSVSSNSSDDDSEDSSSTGSSGKGRSPRRRGSSSRRSRRRGQRSEDSDSSSSLELPLQVAKRIAPPMTGGEESNPPSGSKEIKREIISSKPVIKMTLKSNSNVIRNSNKNIIDKLDDDEDNTDHEFEGKKGDSTPIHQESPITSSDSNNSSNDEEEKSKESLLEQKEQLRSGLSNVTKSRREELLKQLKAVEDAIAKKRSKIL